jgi:hypothetical protein
MRFRYERDTRPHVRGGTRLLVLAPGDIDMGSIQDIGYRHGMGYIDTVIHHTRQREGGPRLRQSRRRRRRLRKRDAFALCLISRGGGAGDNVRGSKRCAGAEGLTLFTFPLNVSAVM